MATETQKAPEAPKHTEPVIADGIQVHDTVHGPVTFINTSLVSQELINLCLKALESDIFETVSMDGGEPVSNGHGVFSVVFRADGYPEQNTGKGWEKVTWMYYPGAHSAVCNLKYCVQSALENALTGGKHSECQNIRHAVWQQLLSGFLHESHHSAGFVADYEAMAKDAKIRAEDEKRCEEYSRLYLFELAKSWDVTPTLGAFMDSMVGVHMDALMTELEQAKDLTDKEKSFLTVQKLMMQTGDAWTALAEDDDHENHIFKSYKQFLHNMSGDATSDPDWGLETPKPENAVPMHMNVQPNNEDAHGNVGPEMDAGASAECYIVDEDQVPGFQGAGGPMQTGFTAQWNGGGQAYQPNTPVQPQANPQAPAAGGAPQAPQANAAPQAPQAPQAPTAGGQPQGGAGGQQMPVAGAAVYPPPNVAPERFQQVVTDLYTKLWDHLFGVLAFNPTGGEGAGFFQAPDKIADQIGLTPEENEIVKEMTCYNAMGQKQPGTHVNGFVSGIFIDNARFLPGWELTLATPEGHQIVRKLFPQNPWNKYTDRDSAARNNPSLVGQYKSTSLRAQQGSQIMWIIDPKATNGECRKIENREYSSNESGSWQLMGTPSFQFQQNNQC